MYAIISFVGQEVFERQNSEYIISAIARWQAGARDFECQQNGYDLVTINNREENDFLQDYITAYVLL